MPESPPAYCNSPGCTAITKQRYCESCTANPPIGVVQKQRSAKRSDPFYTSRVWRSFRVRYLIDNPWCVAKMFDGRLCNAIASQVDHKQAVKQGGDRFDKANLQALCRSCHSSKTAREDGGFGNPKGMASICNATTRRKV